MSAGWFWPTGRARNGAAMKVSRWPPFSHRSRVHWLPPTHSRVHHPPPAQSRPRDRPRARPETGESRAGAGPKPGRSRAEAGWKPAQRRARDGWETGERRARDGRVPPAVATLRRPQSLFTLTLMVTHLFLSAARVDSQSWLAESTRQVGISVDMVGIRDR